jgi:hypothetical protein
MFAPVYRAIGPAAPQADSFYRMLARGQILTPLFKNPLLAQESI